MDEKDYTLFIEARGSHLFGRASGVRTRETVTAITNEIFDVAKDNNLSKALIDVSELKGKLGIMDSYRVVTEVFQNLRGKGINKAAVYDEQASSRREWFLETVAQNRGFNFRIFSDLDKALKWLEL